MKVKKIEVFLRHCFASKIQNLNDRQRPVWYNKEKVFKNFKNTINTDLANYTIIYDEHFGKIDETFLKDEKNVKIIDCGSESKSFLKTIEYVKDKNFDDETIIYFLEDDYLHLDGWCDTLIEGFSIGSSYVTLYDLTMLYGEGFLSEIFMTETCHWKATPTTTNTFACKYKTLLEDYNVHVFHSTESALYNDSDFSFSNDFAKFWELAKNKKYTINPIPGKSTHCDANFLSPFIDWENLINRNYN